MHSRSALMLAFAAASQESSRPAVEPMGEALRTQGDIVTRRSRHAWRNSPLLQNGLATKRRSILKNPRPKCETPEFQQAWDRWAQQCGYRQNHGSLAQILVRIANHLVEDGAVWVQRVQVSTQSGHPNGLLLQLWPDTLRDKGVRRIDNQLVEDGIEWRDGQLHRVHFRARRASPAEFNRTTISILARDLLWLRHAPSGTQIDGLAPAHSAIEVDLQLNDLINSELVKQRVQGNLALVVHDNSPSAHAHNMQVGPKIVNSDGEPIEGLKPGTIAMIRGASGVSTITPQQSPMAMANYEGRIAAGLHYSRELVAGQVGDANFSALRWAVIQRDEVADEFAELVGWQTLLETLAEWVREAELLQNRDFTDQTVEWFGRPRRSIDPVKQVKAEQTELKMGVVSRPQLIRERGGDPEKVDREREEDDAGTSTDHENAAQRKAA